MNNFYAIFNNGDIYSGICFTTYRDLSIALEWLDINNFNEGEDYSYSFLDTDDYWSKNYDYVINFTNCGIAKLEEEEYI